MRTIWSETLPRVEWISSLSCLLSAFDQEAHFLSACFCPSVCCFCIWVDHVPSISSVLCKTPPEIPVGADHVVTSRGPVLLLKWRMCEESRSPLLIPKWPLSPQEASKNWLLIIFLRFHFISGLGLVFWILQSLLEKSSKTTKSYLLDVWVFSCARAFWTESLNWYAITCLACHVSNTWKVICGFFLWSLRLCVEAAY